MYKRTVSPGTAVLQISAAGCSDKGRVREHNEDTIAYPPPSDPKLLAQFGQLYLLADGAGGHAAGEVASRVAVETMLSVYYEQMPPRPSVKAPAQEHTTHPLAPLTEEDPLAQRLQQAFLAAHTRLRELAALNYAYAGMATTCVAAVVKETRLLVAHVGDSRAYLVRTHTTPPTMTCLTSDHSMAAEMVRAGLLSAEQTHHSRYRHVILRALGGSQQDYTGPDITTCTIAAGDRLVLCCDGLWSMLSEEQIASVVSQHPPHIACRELIRLANEAGGEDNISAVVLSCVQTP
jgi:serine/threonine protein phosphatase PrpC